MLTWVFGDVKDLIVEKHTVDVAKGFLELSQARVNWFLSINEDYLPESAKLQGKNV
ncbi:lipopolysaccharide biosynthesis protein WbpB [Nitritalea halalkaliphila LW7]|uniref:Lipopolysaccharide biosynthesis protein WbpB n=2 Tax=Nitritalea TaxID=1187887 RepID=I5C5X4_9BACT|nr:lipopolysaccharide biosynthesis protein WbpB [Nitritalea halalkaliphila LW7]